MSAALNAVVLLLNITLYALLVRRAIRENRRARLARRLGVR